MKMKMKIECVKKIEKMRQSEQRARERDMRGAGKGWTESESEGGGDRVRERGERGGKAHVRVREG